MPTETSAGLAFAVGSIRTNKIKKPQKIFS